VGQHGGMRITLAVIVGLLLAQVAYAEPDSFGFGTGRDNVLTVAAGTTQTFPAGGYLTRSVSAGATVLPVTGIKVNAGDLVMIHESIGLSSLPDVGDGKAVSLAGSVGLGRWELARVSAVAASLTLTAPLRYAYVASRSQVMRVPEYTDVTVEAGGRLTVMPWNGRSGGILPMLVSGRVINEGRIDADGAGYLGGTYAVDTSLLKGCTGLELESEKGGSRRGTGAAGQTSRAGLTTGRGNLANAGGGANCQSAGGGGGGHGGVGGIGGFTASGDGKRVEGGVGGAPLNYSLFDRAVFGGGGGAGHGIDDVGTGGAQGGGVVYIRANGFTGKGIFSASGAAARTSQGSDGAGGGGAGGAVVLRASEIVDCGAVQARGGPGGNTQLATEPFGPGGGGAGGRVLLQAARIQCTQDVSAGNAGVSSAVGAGAYGAGPEGTAGTDGGADGGSSVGGTSVGTVQLVEQALQTPVPPVITVPAAGEVSTSARPRFAGTAGTDGPLVHIVVDGREIGTVVPGSDGAFSFNSTPTLVSGDHTVVAWAESFGVASRMSDPVRFSTPAVVLADGGAVQMAVLVVPANGDTVGPTPLFAGTTPNGVSVGVVIDDGPDHVVPVDLLGRFRYQVPASEALEVGVHKVSVHAHNESGEDGPHSDTVGFEVVVGGPGSDGGTDGGTVDPGVPVVLVPAQDAVVDPRAVFAGVAPPDTSIRLVLDGTAVATVTTGADGAFRHELGVDQVLGAGRHQVYAQAVTAEGEAGPRSTEVGFQVRGPTNLDVGCGCGAGPAGMLSVWALLGLSALARGRRARRS
jgi:hypothetical protein